MKLVIVTRRKSFRAKAAAELGSAHHITFRIPAGFRMPNGKIQVIIDALALSKEESLAIQGQSDADRRIAVGSRGPYENRLAKRHLPDEASDLGELFT